MRHKKGICDDTYWSKLYFPLESSASFACICFSGGYPKNKEFSGQHIQNKNTDTKTQT